MQNNFLKIISIGAFLIVFAAVLFPQLTMAYLKADFPDPAKLIPIPAGVTPNVSGSVNAGPKHNTPSTGIKKQDLSDQSQNSKIAGNNLESQDVTAEKGSGSSSFFWWFLSLVIIVLIIVVWKVLVKNTKNGVENFK